MATQVVMPKLSPTIEEGQLSRWLKKEGEKVSVGEPLAEIDTDKATMEAQALATGVLRKILVPEGETVPLGAIIVQNMLWLRWPPPLLITPWRMFSGTLVLTSRISSPMSLSRSRVENCSS